MSQDINELEVESNLKWYQGITRYQWLVLLIACLGWVFDIFEGQIFVASMNEAMPTFIAQQVDADGQPLTAKAIEGKKSLYNNIALGAFLIGGAIGGIVFGILSDKIGRKKTMSLTILFYSLFTCLSAFSMDWWHLAGFRFLVAMGVGGEWAVASAMVFEVFPRRSRAHVGGIFHASSVLGTYLAIAAGAYIIGNSALDEPLIGLAKSVGITSESVLGSLKWRVGFAIGALPALLIIWIRASLREPDSWQKAQDIAKLDTTQQVGRISELFASGLIRNTFVGFTLAAVGMATFWGVHIHGRMKMRDAGERVILADQGEMDGDQKKAYFAENKEANDRLKSFEMLGMFLVTTGGGIGLICFGPISQAIGRRAAFLFFHLGGLVSALALFQIPSGLPLLYLTLPVFGFLTLGMHAGYAIYFPELFPTRLRGTGSGFCFNGGRIAAAPMLFAVGWLRNSYGFSLGEACSTLSVLYLVGAIVLLAAPETRGADLED